MLVCLDRGVPEAQVLTVLGVGCTTLWRTRAAYLQGGLELALFGVDRSHSAASTSPPERTGRGPPCSSIAT